MNYMARDMLARFDSVRLGVHWVVSVFICSQHVVGFKPGIQSFVGPGSSYSGCGFIDHKVCMGMNLQISFCCCKTMPA
jgi:hypothetical protein